MKKKVVVIGPECTGKSTLCQQLADYYKGNWCPEFAREYLKERGTDYTYEDLLNIAQGQIQLEDNLYYESTGKYYFIDTDMYVMKVWSEVAFEKCHNFILKNIAQRYYDVYLLCYPDLPWVQDDLREYPDPAVRMRLYNMYKDMLVNQSCRWAEIRGTHTERLQTAVGVMEGIFGKKNRAVS